MLRYSVNTSMLFKEVDFLDRFHKAAEAGFKAVEFLWPTDVDLDELVKTKGATGVNVALFNVDSGDMPNGDRGFASWPDRITWWRERFAAAVRLAGQLECSRINVQVGNEVPDLERDVQTECLLRNLSYAAPIARDHGITLMLEALNRFEHPRYLHYRTEHITEVLDRLGEPNVKMQYDVYHMQRMEGNIVATIRSQCQRLGHIQIADSPDRHEPGTGEPQLPVHPRPIGGRWLPRVRWLGVQPLRTVK